MTRSWHIITSEYSPDLGGVADFAKVLAEAISGEVHVWSGGSEEEGGRTGGRSSITVHRSLRRFGLSDLLRTGKEITRTRSPRRLLVQWVPHGFGMRSMNLPFCLWVWGRSRFRGDRVDLFVHEPFLSDVRNLRHTAVALVHRWMVRVLLRSADRIFVSIPAWADALRPYAGRRAPAFITFPLPAGITRIDKPAEVRSVRARLGGGRQHLVGHFGACGGPMLPMLARTVPSLLRDRPDALFVLMGRDSERARQLIVAQNQDLAERIFATGPLAERQLSLHLQACDLVLQPYPDGVSGRRTSLIVALRNGVAAVTTSGHLTEHFWSASGAVAMADAGDDTGMVAAVSRLLDDPALRAALAARAEQFCEERFGVRRLQDLLESD